MCSNSRYAGMGNLMPTRYFDLLLSLLLPLVVLAEPDGAKIQNIWKMLVSADLVSLRKQSVAQVQKIKQYLFLYFQLMMLIRAGKIFKGKPALLRTH